MNENKPLKIIAGAPDRPLIIGDIEIPCYVLEDETRVLVQRGMATAIGMSPSGGRRLSEFVSSQTLKTYISNKLKVVIENPMRFSSPGGIAHGYSATILVDLCKAVLEARDEGVLQKQQLHIAERVDILIRGLATVGIIALVDEATGYQEIRRKRALAKIIEKYIAEDLQAWTKTFPNEFYERIYALKGWDFPEGVKRPAVIGRYTNTYVYERLPEGVLDKLKAVNPPTERDGEKTSTING